VIHSFTLSGSRSRAMEGGRSVCGVEEKKQKTKIHTSQCLEKNSSGRVVVDNNKIVMAYL
jgi:hypothetical protein